MLQYRPPLSFHDDGVLISTNAMLLIGGKLMQNYACKCENGSQVTATILLSCCCSSNRGCKFISYNLVNARNGILIRFDRKILCCKLLLSCLSLKLFSILTVTREMCSIYSWKKSMFRICARECQKTGFLVKCGNGNTVKYACL